MTAMVAATVAVVVALRLMHMLVSALALLLITAPSGAEARPGCSEKEEKAMGESYQKCLNDVNEKSHKEMSKIKSNSDYQVRKKVKKSIRFEVQFP